MAEIVVLGAGVVGLGTALLLAQDGHRVTVLERDPQPPPYSPLDTWTGWQRRGVNQFRLPHFFLARYRAILERELPTVAKVVQDTGGLRYNPVRSLPVTVRGADNPDDHDLDVLTGRRPFVEAALAGVASSTPALTIRRGVTVSGLLMGRQRRPGIPHVGGVRTQTGEDISGDLVVDIMGRRSPLARWMVDAGIRPPHEEVEDGGFMYYSRHYRSCDGTIPVAFGPPLQPLGTISSVTLPADNGTWSVVILTAAHDRALSELRNTKRWERTVRSLPLVAHWLDGEPLDERVVTLGKIEDRIRHYMVDGKPVATGVLSLGDAWACTGPQHGRGATIGMLHGQMLRDRLGDCDPDDAYEFIRSFHQSTTTEIEPWFEWTRCQSRHRLAEIDALTRGEQYQPADPQWEMERTLACAATRDGACLRIWARASLLVDALGHSLACPGLVERITELGAGWRNEPIPAPDREHLVALVNT